MSPGPVARTGAETGGPVPADAVAQGATNPPNPPGSAIPSGNDGSGRLRAEVARALGNAGVSPFEIEDFKIEDVADRLHRVGFRLVVDDDTTVVGLVREFHDAFGVAVDQHATGALRKLRADLVTEECEEARFALIAEDLHAIAKELADVVIVAYGSAISLGIDLDKAVALVHASNMSKLVDGKPVMRGDGKVLKGPDYRPPDMSDCVSHAALREAGQ